jgi:DNA polymerase-4
MIVTVLSESVAARLREQWLKGSVVSINVRDSNLMDWGKQTTIKSPTFLSGDIIGTAMELFKSYNFATPVRNIAVRVSELSSADAPIQTSIFLSEAELQKKERMERAVDDIRYRFGHYSINRAVEYLDKTLTGFSPREENLIHPYSYFR